MKESGDLLQWAIGGLGAVVAGLWHFVLKMRGELSNHKLHVAKTYVCKDEMKDIMDEFTSQLDKRVDRMENKLDRLIENRNEGR